jgi:hypothetical protein
MTCFAGIEPDSGCKASGMRGLGLEPCPKQLDLIEELQRMLFTPVQIDWIVEYIKENFVFLELESYMEFPLNHNYGFDRTGWAIPNSKYNVCLRISVVDEENKWTGKRTERILLIKNSQ